MGVKSRAFLAHTGDPEFLCSRGAHLILERYCTNCVNRNLSKEEFEIYTTFGISLILGML
jgi:hypothetical protein